MKGAYVMAKDFEGTFSTNLFSLQMQMRTLLEDSGGEEAISLLDKLAGLYDCEKKIVIKLFKRTLDKVMTGKERLPAETDEEKRRFEEGLYNDIVSAMRAETRSVDGKLSVIDGGKAPAAPRKGVINLSEIRRSRNGGPKPAA